MRAARPRGEHAAACIAHGDEAIRTRAHECVAAFHTAHDRHARVQPTVGAEVPRRREHHVQRVRARGSGRIAAQRALEVEVLADHHRRPATEETGPIADRIVALQSRNVMTLRVRPHSAVLANRVRRIASHRPRLIETGHHGGVRLSRRGDERREHGIAPRFGQQRRLLVEHDDRHALARESPHFDGLRWAYGEPPHAEAEVRQHQHQRDRERRRRTTSQPECDARREAGDEKAHGPQPEQRRALDQHRRRKLAVRPRADGAVRRDRRGEPFPTRPQRGEDEHRGNGGQSPRREARGEHRESERDRRPERGKEHEGSHRTVVRPVHAELSERVGDEGGDRHLSRGRSAEREPEQRNRRHPRERPGVRSAEREEERERADESAEERGHAAFPPTSMKDARHRRIDFLERSRGSEDALPCGVVGHVYGVYSTRGRRAMATPGGGPLGPGSGPITSG